MTALNRWHCECIFETDMAIQNEAVVVRWLRRCLPDQGILRRNGCRAKRMDVWQRAVDTDRFNPAFRNDEWRSRITDGHPERVVLTYVGRLGAGASFYARVAAAFAQESKLQKIQCACQAGTSIHTI